MVSKVLSTVAKLLPKEIESGTEDSLQWFRTNVRDLKIKPQVIMRGLEAVSNTGLKQGGVYMFHYDAKWKDTLPYWDKYPIVVPLELYSDGFLGINIHYISPSMRVPLLQKMFEFTKDNEELEGDARMIIDYDTTQLESELRNAGPCIKRYLTSHIGARITRVPKEQWETLMMMPTAKFNVNANTVYADSRRKI